MKKGSLIIVITGIICITIISITYFVISYNSKQTELKRKHEIEKIETTAKLKKDEEWNRQVQLQDCINRADNNRSALWKQNADSNNRVQHSTSTWIENRYKTAVDVCRSKYK